MAQDPAPRTQSVYLYIPNIIGYIRVLMNIVAFALCFSNKLLFALLYFISFVCDGVDGWFARKFNQVSTFGAVLDMVTDRCFFILLFWHAFFGLLAEQKSASHTINPFPSGWGWFYGRLTNLLVSTACLLAILCQLYSPGLTFLVLLGLDIASHWLQMYRWYLLFGTTTLRCFFSLTSRIGLSSTFVSGKTSHKDVKDKSWLLRAYYGHRFFMAFCCVGSEVLYIILFLIHNKQSKNLVTTCLNALKENLALSFVFSLALCGWAIKQVINIIQAELLLSSDFAGKYLSMICRSSALQFSNIVTSSKEEMKSAADACVLYDMKRKS